MLFNELVYGPIHSRRLGTSLGINVMPAFTKLCTFDCVYCELGWNTPNNHPLLPTRAEIREALRLKLISLSEQAIQPDVLTFSGNGEPTLHPEFEGIIADTCTLRDQYCPPAKVAVLSNSTQLAREDVIRALKQCDSRILKLDSAIDETMRAIDQPLNKDLTVEQIVRNIAVFNGDFTLQTCFLRGSHNGITIDNTTPEEVSAWYKVVELLHPMQIMIYVIDRATPCPTLEKISREQMDAIAQPLRDKGFSVSVSA